MQMEKLHPFMRMLSSWGHKYIIIQTNYIGVDHPYRKVPLRWYKLQNLALMIRYRSPPLLALRMLSSCTSHPKPNPNPRLHFTLKPTSQNPQTSQLISNPIRISQAMQVSTSCFTGSTDPTTISGRPVLTNSVPESGDPNSSSLVVISFYMFVDFPDHANLRKPLKRLCEELVLV